MPTIAPMRSPIAAEPKAQPISAPTIIAKPSEPRRRPDAVASECGVVGAAIGREHISELVTPIS